MPNEEEGFGLLEYRKGLEERGGIPEPRTGPGVPAPRPGPLPPPQVIPGRKGRKEYQENCHFSCHPFDWIPVDIYDPTGTSIAAGVVLP